MGDVSKHFSRAEFKCKGKTCGCDFAAVDVSLIDVLENVRKHFGAPVTINSACRCKKHNADVGGAKHSKHLYGIAADIVVKGFTPAEVYSYIDSKYPSTLGLIQYGTFVHVDVRSIKYRKVN